MKFFRAMVNTFLMITTPIWLLPWLVIVIGITLAGMAWDTYKKSECFKGEKFLWEN